MGPGFTGNQRLTRAQLRSVSLRVRDVRWNPTARIKLHAWDGLALILTLVCCDRRYPGPNVSNPSQGTASTSPKSGACARFIIAIVVAVLGLIAVGLNFSAHAERRHLRSYAPNPHWQSEAAIDFVAGIAIAAAAVIVISSVLH